MASSRTATRLAAAAPLLAGLLLAGLLLSLTACTGGPAPGPPAGSAPPASSATSAAAPGSSTRSDPTPRDSAPGNPAPGDPPTSGATPSTTPSAPPISTADLEGALLTRKDLPKDYRKEEFVAEAVFSSPNKKCAGLVDRINDLTAGKHAEVGASTIFGRPTGAIIERLDALQDEDAVAADMAVLRRSAAGCPTVVFGVASRGELKGRVRLSDPPPLGDDALSIELTFAAVPTATVPFTVVQLGSVELQVLAVDGSSTAKMTTAAVAKAEDELPG